MSRRGENTHRIVAEWIEGHCTDFGETPGGVLRNAFLEWALSDVSFRRELGLRYVPGKREFGMILGSLGYDKRVKNGYTWYLGIALAGKPPVSQQEI